jgi:hypothetical protein
VVLAQRQGEPFRNITVIMPIRGHDPWVVQGEFVFFEEHHGWADRTRSYQEEIRTGFHLRQLTITYPGAGRKVSRPAPDNPITRRMLREISPTDLWRAAEDAVIENLREGVEGLDDLQAALTEPRRPGPRRQWTDAKLARLARRYVERYAADGAPYAGLANEWHLSMTAVRNAISLARKRNLLTETRQGLGGGVLTAKAIALLKEHDDGTRGEARTAEVPGPIPRPRRQGTQ